MQGSNLDDTNYGTQKTTAGMNSLHAIAAILMGVAFLVVFLSAYMVYIVRKKRDTRKKGLSERTPLLQDNKTAIHPIDMTDISIFYIEDFSY